MTWSAFHKRGDVLRAVIDEANARQDGTLPTYVAGVHETFRDDLDLVAALLLRWNARLSGNLERRQMDQPMDLETAVVEAWVDTAEADPGLRAVLDEVGARPRSDEMATALEKATNKTWTTLALLAGRSSVADQRAAETGRRIEQRARHTYASRIPAGSQPVHGRAAAGRASLVDRLRAAIHAA